MNKLTLLGQGGEAAVYALDDERVLRLCQVGTRLEDVTRRTDLLTEITDHAAHLPFETPIVLEQTVIDGQIATIEKRIAGESMDRALKTVHGAERRTLIEHYLEVAVQVAEIGIERPFFGEMCHETPIVASDWRTFLMRRAEKSWSRKDTKARRMIEDVVARMPDVERGQFVHLDYFPGNVMVDQGRVSAVIDFGYACVMGDGRMMPCLAAAYLTLGRTADVSRPDMKIANAWLEQHRLLGMYPAVIKWMAMYWMFVDPADDPMTRDWCETILGK